MNHIFIFKDSYELGSIAEEISECVARTKIESEGEFCDSSRLAVKAILNGKARDGGLWKTHGQIRNETYVLFHQPSMTIYIFKTDDLLQFLDKRKSRFENIEAQNLACYLVPIGEIKHLALQATKFYELDLWQGSLSIKKGVR